MGHGGFRRSPVLVGRDEEVASLTGALDAAQRGRGGTVFVVGEAGIGKTRLLHEAKVEAARRGMTVLDAAAPATRLPPAFGLVAGALRSWLRSASLGEAEELRPFAAGLHLVLPEWPTGQVPELSADQLRLLAAEGSLRLLLRAADGSGALVLLDDLQNADTESVAFVQYVAGALENLPVLVVATIRQLEGRAAEAEAVALAQRGVARVVHLDPLGALDVSTFVEALIGGRPPGGFVADVLARTNGVPLLVEQVVEASVEAGVLRWAGGRAVLADEARPVLPGTVVDVVGEKLRRMPRIHRHVLEVAAVLDSVEDDVLALAAGVDSETLAAAIAGAEDLGLIVALGGVRFRHALIQEAVRACIPASAAAEHHRAAARALTALRSDEPQHLEAIAGHHHAAGARDEAARLLVASAASQLAAMSLRAAEAAARRAHDIAVDSEIRRRARSVLAEVLTAQGRWAEAFAIDGEADDGADARALLRMARNAARLSRFGDARSLLERARVAGADPAAAAGVGAEVALEAGDLDAADIHAIHLLELGAPPRLACTALYVVGKVAEARGDTARAAEAFGGWEELARREADVASRIHALLELGQLNFFRGEPAHQLREAILAAGQVGAFVTEVWARITLAFSLVVRGELAEASEVAAGAVALCRELRLDVLPFALLALADSAECRSFGSGEDLLDEALSLAPGSTDALVLAGTFRGRSALRRGDWAQAISHLDPVLDCVRSSPSAVPADGPFLRVIALLAAGRHGRAAEALDEARELAVRRRVFVNDLLLRVSEAFLARSPAAVERALEGTERSARFYRALALVLAAGLVPGPHATGWLREALQLFESAGAETDAARARRLLRAAGARVPQPRRHAAAVPPALRARGVTGREADVLGLLAGGLSNQEIAERLFLSVRTVETHTASLLHKLGLPTRGALVAFAASLAAGERNLVRDPE